MKRICIGLLTALGCIAVATALIVRPFSKKSIQSYVLRNQDELTNYARKVIWSWAESEGDNTQYTERIAAHWYWYEAKF